MAAIPWRMQGEEIANCGCVWACPCQFMALPTRGNCEAFIGFRIDHGRYGDLLLDGLKVAAVYAWPGAIHQGDGQALAVIDQSASPAQREALLNILSGKAGGGPFEVYAATVSRMEPPQYLPIVFEIDREARTARLEVEGVGSARSEPIRNPVTGETHRVRIDLPNGFEYKQAEVADAVYVHARIGGRDINFEHTYSQLNAFEWGNA